MRETPEDDLRGQMTIDEWLSPRVTPEQTAPAYEVPEAAVEEPAEESEEIVYGTRSCAACIWRTKDKTCKWADHERRPGKPAPVYTYPSCEGYGSFEPCMYKVPQMCANCKWSSCFCYETKPEYIDYKKLTGKEHRDAFRDPVEEPNIYCEHPEGSLNRRTAYKDVEWPGFGACHWDRQHEWDTCDRWEIERGTYIDFTDYFPQYKKKH